MKQQDGPVSEKVARGARLLEPELRPAHVPKEPGRSLCSFSRILSRVMYDRRLDVGIALVAFLNCCL